MLLWVARFYAVWAFAFNLIRLLYFSFGPNAVIINHDVHTGISYIVTYHGPTSSLLFHVLFYACLSFGLLLLHRLPGRIMVGIASVSLLAMDCYGGIHLAYLIAISNSVSAEFLHSKLSIIIAVSICNAALTFAYIWLALRPPEGTKSRNGNSLPNHHPLPQSC